uniref:Glutathione synthase n=1 Tax=Chlamydomonas euryale TaxID=1486919 RepID=A0A7R9Z3P2_9CHLO|mmetsp:Transcript_41523/g.124088  ORF Transcript_41523/g.124088 Transcript_41523/m.124088 type:complete len:258 (+) Transcript_41523:466-1239(+)
MPATLPASRQALAAANRHGRRPPPPSHRRIAAEVAAVAASRSPSPALIRPLGLAQGAWLQLPRTTARMAAHGESDPVDAADAVINMDALVNDATMWANQHGMLMGLGGSAPSVACIHAPLAAQPVYFPKERFMQAKTLMPLLAVIMDEVARDEAYLEATLAAAAESDTEFTGRLLALLRASRRARAKAPELALAILRSDYMLDVPSGTFLQVEMNTIASSFGCLSSLATRLHKYLHGRGHYKDMVWARLDGKGRRRG